MRVVLFLCLIAGLYFLVTNLLAIRTITVVGNNIQVKIDQNRFPGTLLFFPAGKLRSEILSDNPVLADIRFELQYPHTIIIIPKIREPFVLLVTPSRRVTIDRQGIVLADADTNTGGLPKLFSPISGIHIGQKIADSRVMSGLTIISEMQTFAPVETVSIDDAGQLRAHTGNLDILFTQDSASTAAATLQTLLAGFRIKGTLPRVIDLRFNKPVITN